MRSIVSTFTIILGLLTFGPNSLGEPQKKMPKKPSKVSQKKKTAIPAKDWAKELEKKKQSFKDRKAVLKPKTEQKRVLAPKPEKSSTTYFQLKKTAPGTLQLSFKSSDAQHTFDQKSGVVAQLFVDPPLEMKPSIITDWPVGHSEMTLKYSKGTRGKIYNVKGEISYTVCRKDTNKCSREIARVFHRLVM